MAKGTVFCGQALDEWFFADPLPWRDDTLFRLSLHTAVPEDDAGAFANEVDYLGYRAVEIQRSAAAWQRNGRVVTNLREIRFPVCDELERRRLRVTHWALRPFSREVVFRYGAFETPFEVYARLAVVIDKGSIRIEER